MKFNPQPKPEKTKKKPRKGISKKKAKDAKLWKAFSLFIRLRDCDDNGYGSCITCNRWIHWKKGDCGHGVGRQHWGTKYNERNNHLQCKGCNGFDEGNKANYKLAVDKKYGPNTWDILQASRNGKEYTQVECDLLEKHYMTEARKLAKQKGQVI